MKTDLLIFGDSYANEYKAPRAFKFLESIPHIFDALSISENLTSYHSIIRKSNVFKSVTSYGLTGDDVWNQYKKFKEVYTGTEAVLFFETTPFRITAPGEWPCPGLFSVEEMLNTRKKHSKELEKWQDDLEPCVNALNAAIGYFKYLQRDDFDIFSSKNIVREIYNACPNVLILPNFSSSTTFINKCLCDISMSEFKLTDNAKIEHYELRRNHLTEENHVILAEKIINFFINDIPFDFENFSTSHNPDFKKYYLKL
jgi:hypothetical protein